MKTIKLTEKELKKKLDKVYNALIEPYEKEVEEVIMKLTPMFQLGKSEEEIINIAKKMLMFRGLK